MPQPQLIPEGRLHGVSIFLSASVPAPERAHEYERIPEAPLRIEEAVIAIARAIFLEGGTLVFGAHPSISPLVARVIDHYYLPAPAEPMPGTADKESPHRPWQNPSLLIYQSRVWEPYWAEATERLTRHHLVKFKWIDAVPGESIDLSVKDRAQAPESMEKMRRAMIQETSPVAMIAIGGMKGVLDEARIFAELRPGKPIYAFTTTGGATALLPRRAEYANRLRVPDQGAEDLVRKFWYQQEEFVRNERLAAEQRPQEGAESARQFYIPYSFVARQTVAEIITHLSER